MNINEYQEKQKSTAIYPGKIIYPALGLNGESGEVAEKIKKVIRDKKGDFDDVSKWDIARELGDCLWYISALANDIGYTLQEIAEINIEKLESRKDRNVLNGSGDNR